MRTFDEFWPFYLREHSRPATRALHYLGTSLATLLLVGAAASGRYWLFALAPLCGYGFAWYAHFVVEKNRPATFEHPLWSFAADYRMLACAVRGTLPRELDRAQGG